MEKIRDIVEKHFNVNIANKSRMFKYVFARFCYYTIARNQGHTFYAIAKSIGKDHSSIMYGIKQLKNLIEFDYELRNEYDTLANKFEFYKNKRKERTTAQLLKLCNKHSRENKKLKEENTDLMQTIKWITDLQ